MTSNDVKSMQNAGEEGGGGFGGFNIWSFTRPIHSAHAFDTKH